MSREYTALEIFDIFDNDNKLNNQILINKALLYQRSGSYNKLVIC